MIKVNLSDEYIKAVTGSFDLETIFDLELTQKHITSLGSLPKCISLVYLDLSQNRITDINGIDNLIELEFLDLSFNNISNIAPLGSLLKLRNLKLQGNNIDGPLPGSLKYMKKLEKISFKCIDMEDNKNKNNTNPICSTNNYRKNIFEIFTNLKWLDNIPKGMEEVDYNYQDDDDNDIKKIDVNDYKFEFEDEIKLNVDEFISKEDIDNTKKEILNKYLEYEKGIEDIKKDLAKIKVK